MVEQFEQDVSHHLDGCIPQCSDLIFFPKQSILWYTLNDRWEALAKLGGMNSNMVLSFRMSSATQPNEAKCIESAISYLCSVEMKEERFTCFLNFVSHGIHSTENVNTFRLDTVNSYRLRLSFYFCSM